MPAAGAGPAVPAGVTAGTRSVVPDAHHKQASPMIAGQYIETTVGVKSLPLTPWQGLGVLALWAFGALLLGGLLLRFRDA